MAFLRMIVSLLAVSGVSAAAPRANAHAAHRLAPEALLAMKEAPEPMFTTSTMPKVSPAVYSVIVFSAMYFVLFTVLAIVRSVKTFKQDKSLDGIERIFKTGTDTMMYAPMLCALFLGARMRGIQLAQGETEKYKLPQPWVQLAMLSTLVSVFFQVVIVLLMPVFTNEAAVEVVDGEVNLSKMNKPGVAGVVLTVVRYTLMLMLYGGFTTVIVGIFMMEGPAEIWQGKQPPVSPAVFTTVLLTSLFFTAYLGVAVVKTLEEFKVTAESLTKLKSSFNQAKPVLNMAPMLCILFIGARMRALQMDPKNGNPQRWAQMCFYACAGAVAIQFFLVVLSPFLPGVSSKAATVDGDIAFTSDNATAQMCLTALRYAALLCVYGGSTAVMVSVFTIEHPTDVSLTPPISPAMQCVMNLTVQYFTIYLAYFICVTVSQFRPDLKYVSQTLVPIFDGAKCTVAFAPMLSMLFIGARMRALQLTKATDGTIPPSAGPQPWAQQGMFLASWSVLIQVILTIVVPLVVGEEPKFDEQNMLKTPTSPPGGKIVGYVLDAIRYLCLLSMYGGATLVVVAVFKMTPETLQPYASMAPLVPGAEVAGVKVPGVEVPAPPTPPTPQF